MRILLNTRLAIKLYYKPIVDATAQEFADAGRIIWEKTKNTGIFPKKYRNGKKFAKITNKEKGDIFYKKIFGGYKLTPKGKNWIQDELFMHYLPNNTTIGTFMKTIISKINYLKKYKNNIYKSPF